MGSHDDYLLRALMEEGLIDAAGMARARDLSAERSLPIDEAIVEAGVLSGREVAITRALMSECVFVDLDRYAIDITHARLLPRSVAVKHSAFPLFIAGGIATVGMTDPLNVKAIDQVRQHLRLEIDPVLCVPSVLRALIAKAYSMLSQVEGDSSEASAAHAASDLTTGEEPIVAAVNQIIADAVAEGASDIHISPCEHELQLRYRIDGELQHRQGPPLTAHAGLVQRLKVMAHLDLTQNRRPQDGKFRFVARGEMIEVRLSTMPTVAGENVVMRVIRTNAQILGFGELGVSQDLQERVHGLLARPYGMLLVTGPTGSGKSSTLYTAVKRLNTPDRNIMTIEDPVEVRVAGVRQIQTNAEIGLTFAGALRSILRQDPDVVLVGEIRDSETASIAAQASLTGHLVLSTLHTNDAAGAVARLRDLGVPPFVINASLLAVLAQRLVRRTCQKCARATEPDALLLRRFGVRACDGVFQAGAGCGACASTGFRGRLGIFEMLMLDAAVQQAIERGVPTQELRRIAGEHGMRPMWRDGLDKALAGITTLAEVGQAVATVEADTGDGFAGRIAA